MTDSPTLADDLFRMTFNKRFRADMPDSPLQSLMRSARRFVLDDSMSSFLADLGSAAFTKNLPKNPALLDQMRIGARAPHALTWVEFDLHRYLTRAGELLNEPPKPLAEIPETEGWL